MVEHVSPSTAPWCRRTTPVSGVEPEPVVDPHEGAEPAAARQRQVRGRGAAARRPAGEHRPPSTAGPRPPPPRARRPPARPAPEPGRGTAPRPRCRGSEARSTEPCVTRVDVPDQVAWPLQASTWPRSTMRQRFGGATTTYAVERHSSSGRGPDLHGVGCGVAVQVGQPLTDRRQSLGVHPGGQRTRQRSEGPGCAAHEVRQVTHPSGQYGPHAPLRCR